jgi:hypothetical protein
MVLQGSEQESNANAGLRSSRHDFVSRLMELNPQEPLNVTEAVWTFYTAVAMLTQIFIPMGSGETILSFSLSGTNYSSITIYYGAGRHSKT